MEDFNAINAFTFEEKRRATRQKAYTAAHVHFNKANSSYEALVRNMSATGARLKFGEMIALPKEFEVQVGKGNSYHTAHVAWQCGLEIGVAFTPL